MNKEFTKKEDDLQSRWIASYSTEDQEQFCFDGLIYYRDPDSNDDYEEVVKWEKAKRKILFLMKDTNGNPGDDYRWWKEFYTIKGNFFRNIIKCLWALNKVDIDYRPDFNNNKTIEEYTTESIPYPMAIVNVKKIAGGSHISNAKIWSFYKTDRCFIIEQVKDILKPNIIVCGGGSGTILNIAKDIYSDVKFEKHNDWCYYCKQCDLLLIDDYHPSYPSRDNQEMINAVYEFYQKKNNQHIQENN